MRRRRRTDRVSVTVERTASAGARAAVPLSDEPEITVAVVTFGAPEVALRCLESIVANTDPAETPYEVVVVDNVDDQSGEEQPSPTTEALRACTSGVLLLPSPVNTGFGGGNNLAATAARGSYLCLCNPDAEVPSGWATPLMTALDDPAVGIAAPALVNPDGSPQEFGQVLLDSGFTLAIGGPELFPGDWSQAAARVVDYASAAFWVTRRDDFVRLGGFDARYHPAYWEDVDLALRYGEAGLATKLVPEVRVTHEKGGSSDASLALAQRSHARFVERWADRLRCQPSHPRTDEEMAAARDHASSARRVTHRKRRAPNR